MPIPKLKIATWNLDRPKLSSELKNEALLTHLRNVEADILVLTETNSCIDLSAAYKFSFATTCLYESLALAGEPYGPGENRVTIWSKLAGRRRVDVCNSHSAICAQFETNWGALNVYGTVIGIYGKDRIRTEPRVLDCTDFEISLSNQMADWKRLIPLGDLCIVGDFNLTLGDNFYFKEEHRARLLECLAQLDMEIPTKELDNNVDHIAVSNSFIKSFHYEARTWHSNRDKKISDHQGVLLTLEHR